MPPLSTEGKLAGPFQESLDNTDVGDCYWISSALGLEAAANRHLSLGLHLHVEQLVEDSLELTASPSGCHRTRDFL